MCEFTFPLRKFTEPARSCLLQLVGSAHMCEFTFPLRKFTEPARSCLLQLVGSAHILLFGFASSRTLLARASCNLAGSAHPCEFTFRFASSLILLARASCNLAGSAHPCEFTFRFASSLILLARASCNLAGSAHPCEFTFRFASSLILLARASCNLAGSAHPCEFTFRFASSLILLARASCNLAGSAHPCEFTFRFASSLILLARASCNLAGSAHPCEFTFRFASSLILLARASCNLAGSAHPCEFTFRFASSLILLARASCNLAGSAHPCEFTFRFASSLILLARASCNLAGSAHPCEFTFRFASSLILLARASCNLAGSAHPCEFTFRFASSLILLARASCNLVGSGHMCEFTFPHRKFPDPARSCILQPCRVCSPLRATFLLRKFAEPAPSCLLQPCRVCSPQPCRVCSPVRVYFSLRKFADPARSCILQPCRVCSPVRVYFSASHVHRACSLVPLATLLGLLTRASLLFASQVRRPCSLVHLATLPGLLTLASLLFYFASSRSILHRAYCNLAGSAHPLLFRIASSPSLLARAYCNLAGPAIPCEFTFRFASSLILLARASCNLVGSAHMCELTFPHRKFPEPARSCLLQPCRACYPVRVYFSLRKFADPARSCLMQPCRVCSHFTFRFASSLILLARASCNLVGSAHMCELTFPHRKFPEPARSCLLQPCRACYPVRVYFSLRKFADPARSCLMQPCRVCSHVRAYFSASQVPRACSLVPIATLPGLLSRASLLFASQVRRPCSLVHLATLPGLLTRASLLFASQVRRPCSLVHLATLPGRLTLASLLFYFASSRSLLHRAYCNLAGSAHPCEFTFLLRKFAEPARLCLIQSCRVCSPVRVYFPAPQVRRATSLVPLATLPGRLTLASLLFYFASSRSLLHRAYCNLAGSAHPCEFTFLLRKFAEPTRLCLIQSCQVCSPVRVYFSASAVLPVCLYVPLATLPGLLTRASLLFGIANSLILLARASCNLVGSAHISPSLLARAYCNLAGPAIPCEFTFRFASSPTLLARASCNLAVSAHPCEFTFLLRKFAEPAPSCLMQPCRVSSPERVYFSASQVRRACSLVPHKILPSLFTRASLLFDFASSPACSLVPLATLPVLLTCASLIFRFASSPSLLARVYCNLAGSAQPSEFTFLLRNFAEPSPSCLLQPCRVCSAVQVYFSASQVHRACSLVPLAALPVRRARSLVPHTILPGLLTRASLLFGFASSLILLAHASCNLAGSAHPSEFTFPLRKFTEPARSCLLQPCRVCSPERVYFSASQVHRACSLVPLAALPGLLTRASLLFRFASSPSLLARASCSLAGSAHPSEFTFPLRKFTEPARSCLLQPCRVCSPERVYFSASQVHRACSLVPLAALPGLLTRASLLFCFVSSPSPLACTSYNLAGSAHPSEFTFRLRKFADPARSCLLQPCRVCSPVRVYFSASKVRPVCSHVPLATLPGLLTRASLLFGFACSPILLARASCNLAGSAHLCEFTFPLRKFTEPARSCLLETCRACYSVRVYFSLRKFADPARSCILQPCRVCSPLRVYFSASQVRRACFLVSLETLLGLLTRASLLFASQFTFLLRKFAEPASSCLLKPCWVCSPVRVYFSASQVRRACSLVPHTILPGLLTRASLLFASQVRRPCSLVHLATLPGLLTRASLLFCFESSPSLFARASCNLDWSSHPCEFTFRLRKFADPARSCLLQPCRVCSPVLVYFSLRKFADPARSCILQPCRFAGSAPSCLLQPCRVCSPVGVHFSSSQVRRTYSLVPHTILPGLLNRASLLFRIASSPSLLARAYCNLAGPAIPCEFTFRFASSPSLLARASCSLAGSAHPCELTFPLRKFAEPARSCLLQPCRLCSPVRAYFPSSQVRRACSLVPLAALPALLTRASLLSLFASSPSLLARASCSLAGSAHPCELTFPLRKFAEPARSCLLQPCRICSPVRVYFSASHVHRACSLVPLVTLPVLLTCASLLFRFASSTRLLARAYCNLAGPAIPCEFTFRFASSPTLLARASCKLAGSAHPSEFTFLLRKFAEPSPSCLLQPCRVCSAVRVYFSASQVHRACSLVPLAALPGLLTRASLLFGFASSPACSLVPLATLPGLLTRASLLFCFASSPSLLACASYNLAGSAQPCEFTFPHRKFPEPARSCLLQPCRACYPVRVYFSLRKFADPARSSILQTCRPCEFTFPLRKFTEPARSCLLQPCRVCSPVRVYFSASQVHQPARSCLLQPCRVCSPERVYFSASQVRRACSLVPHTILPGLLNRASLLFRIASSPSLLARAYCNLAGPAIPCEFTFRFASSPTLLARASCKLAGSAHPSEFTFLLRKFAEPSPSCLLQPCRVCSAVRVYFSASQVHRACSLVPLAALPGLLTRASLLFGFASSPACSLVPLATLPGLLTRASLLFCFASSPSLLACASYNLAGSAQPCEFTFPHRKFPEPARSCLLQPCRACYPVRVYFSLRNRASLLFRFASSPSLLARASCSLAGSAHPCEFTFRLRKFTSLLARASCNLAGSAHPSEFTFLLRKFAEPARLCLIQSCRVCSTVRVYFSASQVPRACSLVPIATLPGLLSRASLLFASQVRRPCSLEHLANLPGLLTLASLLFYFASSLSLLHRAYCNLAGSAQPCEFTFPLRKFTEPARSCLLQPCRVCSPVRVYFSASQVHQPARSCLLQPCRVCSPERVYFSASQVRRACSLVPHTILPGLLNRASLLFRIASSPSLLARAYCNLAGPAIPCEFTFRFASSPTLLARASCKLAGSAHPSEFTFLLRKFAEPSPSCLLQPCRVCSAVRVYFSASQVHRACSLVPLAALPGLLTRASLLFCFASSPSLLPRASCNLAEVCSPVRVYFSASTVLPVCSYVPLATLPGLLTRASLLFGFANSLILLARASCNLVGSAHMCEFTFRFASSPTLLARASCNLAVSAQPCEFAFLLRKFAEPAPSCLLQPCRVCSPERVYFSASHVHRACSLVPLAALPGLLTRASLLFGFACSPCLLARASCSLAGSAHPSEFTFRLRMFTVPARSCLLQPCRVCSPERVYFSASHVHRACSLVPLAALPGLLTRASLLFGFACSPCLLARASCSLAGSAHPSEFTFRLRMFTVPARSCLLQPCRVCSPERVYFSASHVHRACSLVPLAALPGLLTRASLLFGFACSPCLLARASCSLAGSAHPSEFTFRLRMFTVPARSCLLQPCRVCSPERVYFSASHVHRACSLVPLAALPGLLTRASLLFGFACSPCLLARASCSLAGSAHPSEFTFRLRMFTVPARSCLLQPCRVCSPERVYFSASHVHRACSLVPLAALPGLLTRASLLFGFACSPCLLARASCSLAGSAHPSEFTFRLRMFTVPARSCLLQPCRVCSPERVYFSASHVHRACSLVPLAALPGLLTRASLLFGFACSPCLLARASCSLAGSAHPSEFTFRLRMFTVPARSCLLQPCRVCSPERVYFSASHVHRACSLVPLAALPGLLTRASLLFGFACSPCLLARASCSLAGSAHPSEFTFRLRMFTVPARSCLLQPCRVCSPERVYFSASHVHRACSLVPLAALPGLLTRASLLFGFACSPCLLARASCSLAGSAHPSEFTFRLRMFTVPARSCLLQPCRVCSPERVYFSASHVHRACSLVPLAALPGLLTRASLLFGFACSPCLLARASCSLAGSAHPSEFTFRLRMFTVPARSCLLQPCRVCSPERVYFSASHVHRACSLVPLAALPGLLTRASLLFGFACSPCLLARASCSLAGSAHPSEFTFRLRMFTVPARSCLLQPCRVCSPERVYFSASHVHRACSLVPLAALPGLLTRASLLFGFACSPCLLARASCSLAGSAHPSEFTFRLRMFTVPARSCLLQPCRVCSPERVYFSASHVHRACSLVPLAALPGLLTRASLLFGFACSPCLLARASCNLVGSAHMCEFTFPHRKFPEPARSCLFSPSLLACASYSLVGSAHPCEFTFRFASSPTLLARASCNLAGSAHPCEFTFRFASSPTLLARASCNLAGSAHPCEFTFRFASSPTLLARASCNLAGSAHPCEFTFRFASSPTLLARASCNLAGSAHPCEFTFLLRKFAEPARLCLIQSCRVCSPVRVYFSVSKVR
ncbi:hypothetical protein CRG98_021686 [Punica granatum]|uniref:Uncharacterized protein n=1 Tax=Punica granatum TaxID=22663 RepID=A0A2I0JNV4_PUNGR|nr:hypothetical protein CRG98_021686 [Punica granatum]